MDKPLPKLLVSADDYGLTKGNTDTMLETVDAGTVSNVSILANGESVPYALAEYARRAPRMELSVHLNLTEGRALSVPSEATHLTDAHGDFKYSFLTLWLRYALSGAKTRAALKREVAAEALLQIRRIADDAQVRAERIALNGHQHVHMLPFVFEALMTDEVASRIHFIRLPEEPFFFVPARWYIYLTPPFLKHVILNVLSRRVRGTVNVSAHDAFVGVIFTGRMTADAVSAGIRKACAEGAETTEVLFHPGSAAGTEKVFPCGHASRLWHYSPWRTRERNFLTSEEAKHVFVEAVAPQPQRDRTQLLRYAVSGCFAAATHLGGLYFLTEYAHVWYVLSNIVAYCGGIIVSFSFQKFWTFKDRSTDRIPHQLFSYTLVQFVSLAINTYGLYLLVTLLAWWYLAAEIVMMLLVAVGNFFIFQKVIFRTHSAQNHAGGKN